jgi:hypothetical protein
MKRFLLSIFLISAFCFRAFAQKEAEFAPIVDPDIFYKMSWEQEKELIDNFAIRIVGNKDSIGIISLGIDNKTTERQLKIRLSRILNRLTKINSIEKNHFRLVLYRNFEEKTMYFIVPESELSNWEKQLIITSEDDFKYLSKLFPKK